MWIGVLAWTVPLVAIAVGVLRREPGERSLDPVYRWGVDAWRMHLDLYLAYGGDYMLQCMAPYGRFLQPRMGLEYLYPPSFLMLYKPFVLAPVPWGEIVWRCLGAGGMAALLARLMRVQSRPWNHFDFVLLSIGVLPVSLGAIQGGQANVVIAVCLLGATLAMVQGRAVRAGLWLALGCGIKPFMLAPVGLAFVLCPASLLGVVLGALLVFGVPFLTAPVDYVLDQYMLFARNTLGPCLNAQQDRFADINGLLRMMDMPMQGWVSSGTRALAGLLCAAWMLRVRTRMSRADAAMTWLAVSAGYLMLCNPLTEANSYCLLAVPMVLFAWRWIDAGHGAAGWGSFLALMGMGLLSELIRPIDRAWGAAFDLRFMPLATLAFLAAVLVIGPPTTPRPQAPPSH